MKPRLQVLALAMVAAMSSTALAQEKKLTVVGVNIHEASMRGVGVTNGQDALAEFEKEKGTKVAVNVETGPGILEALPRLGTLKQSAEDVIMVSQLMANPRWPLNIKGAQIYGRPISRLLRSLLDGSYEAQQFGWRGEPEHPTGKSFHSSKVALSLLLSVIDHKSEEGPIKAFRTSRRELITAISAQTGYRSSNNSPQA